MLFAVRLVAVMASAPITSAVTELASLVLPLQDAGGSLVQGAKEGFVGAYDAAASAAASATDTIKDTAARATGSSSDQQKQQQSTDKTGDGFGHGSGSSSSPSGGGYAGGERSSLGQAWEDLKHGGSKAPHAVSIAVSTRNPVAPGMAHCSSSIQCELACWHLLDCVQLVWHCKKRLRHVTFSINVYKSKSRLPVAPMLCLGVALLALLKLSPSSTLVFVFHISCLLSCRARPLPHMM